VTSRPLTAHDLDDVRLLVAPRAHEQGTEIVWQTELGLGDALALPSTPVRQILINLALNAIQAAGRNGHVRVRTESDAERLSIVVENDGERLSAAQRASLFEPFSRFSENGHGLGLWICYQIVTQLRGEIRAESSADSTRFIVKLPLGE
jgi:signal transduction histidine kinase